MISTQLYHKNRDSVAKINKNAEELYKQILAQAYGSPKLFKLPTKLNCRKSEFQDSIETLKGFLKDALVEFPEDPIIGTTYQLTSPPNSQQSSKEKICQNPPCSPISHGINQVMYKYTINIKLPFPMSSCTCINQTHQSKVYTN